MKKFFVLAFVMLLCTALLFGVASPAKAAESKFEVGFARVDINPYIDPTLTGSELTAASNIMQLPLRGTGDVWNRLSNIGLVDDNGDGVVDENDGLKVTCIAVTDEDGTTALMLTIDLIGGSLFSKVSKVICTRVNEAVANGTLENVSLTEDQIYLAGTHTHNAPDISVYVKGGRTDVNNDGVSLKEVNENLGIWIDRTVENTVNAVIQALQDRAPATMSRDQLSASQVQSTVVAGKTMCMTRHYVNAEDGSVAGDNFNARGDDPQQVTEVDDTMYLLNFTFEDSTKLPISMVSWRGHPSLNNSDDYKENGGRHCLSSDYINSFRYALEHGVDVTVSSGDNLGYVQTWQYGQTQKYRVAFFQSTGGNVNPRGHELIRDAEGNVLTYTSGTSVNNVKAYSWIDVSGKNAKIGDKVMGRACSYGVVLATMANEALTDGKNSTELSAGNIRFQKATFSAERKLDGVNAISYAAANCFREATTKYDEAYAAYTTANSKYTAYKTAKSKYDDAGILGFLYQQDMVDALNEYHTAMEAYTPLLEAYEAYMNANTNNKAVTVYTEVTGEAAKPNRPVLTNPVIYKTAEGETYAIASRFHANAIIADWNAKLNVPQTTEKKVTVQAFMLGDEVAMVSIPGEPFDYYYKEPGVYTPENNMWNDLLDDTYGKPFVLGYCNGASGYFPNYEAYNYNRGRNDKAIGSYEVHTSDYGQGTGERMLGYLNQMLRSMNADTRQAYCQHCKEDVTWQPYEGQAPLDVSGHYYLASDYAGPQLGFGKTAAVDVCFDLNGYTFTGDNRAFYVYKKSSLHVMDTSAEQTGIVQGAGGECGVGAGYGGATLLVESGAVCDLYSGTFQSYARRNYSVATGGVARVSGTLNMYGGKLLGGIASSFTGQYLKSNAPVTPAAARLAKGGTLALAGTLNMYGGEIASGKLQMITGTVIGDATLGYAYSQETEQITGVGACVYVESGKQVNIYGDAKIADLYFAGGNQKNLTVNGAFTGQVQITYPSSAKLAALDVIGAAKRDAKGNKPDLSDGVITFAGYEDLTPAIYGTDLILSETPIPLVYCEGCKKNVPWTVVYDGDFLGKEKELAAGHYILAEDISNRQLQLNYNIEDSQNTYCFDLAGHTITSTNSRAFYLYGGATMNLMDSVGGGSLNGIATARGGGALLTEYNTTFNLYGGTINGVAPTTDKSVKNGGAFQAYGDVNIYGGTVRGAQVTSYGGAIYMNCDAGNNATLSIYGGTILAGEAKYGNCIYVKNTNVVLGGDAEAAELYFVSSSAQTLTVDTTDKAFTGTASLRYSESPAVGADVGNYTGTMGMEAASVTIANTDHIAVAEGTELVVAASAAQIYENDAFVGSYSSLSGALNAYTHTNEKRNYIKLTAPVSQAVTVSKDVYLDLNGFDITGNVTVKDGSVLYGMDSLTDDYTVADGKYGKLTGTISGTVKAVSESTVGAVEGGQDLHRAGYLKVTGENGVSFHRVNLEIYAMSLRASCVGVYYRSYFRGDEVAAASIDSFGIAFSVAQEPTKDNMNTRCIYTAYENFQPGVAGNTATDTGVLLQNVMKEGLSVSDNENRANMAVWGRSYIRTEDGYLYGASVKRTLKEQLVAIDDIYDQLTDSQRGVLLNMYEKYEAVMASWDLTKISAGYEASK